MPDNYNRSGIAIFTTQLIAMLTSVLSIREIEPADVPLLTSYWITATEEHLRGMGADPARMPAEEDWHQRLYTQIATPYHQKLSWALILLIDGIPSGHCNINKITPDEQAWMHLHLWQAASRQKGAGSAMVHMAIPYFFRQYNLKRLYCEPYALNPAPNATLKKAGFGFVRQAITQPDVITFEQPTNLWVLTLEDFDRIYGASNA